MGIASGIVKALRLLTGRERPKTAAVILAAGLGTRMGAAVKNKKQFLSIEGIPVFIRSLLAFDACEVIDELVLVIGREDLRPVKRALASYTIKKPLRVVYGGAVRQESARRGFEALSKGMRFVAIHDAARCLITPEAIRSVVLAAHASRAASAACRSTDTLKRVNADGFVLETVDREEIFRAQTPQVFACDLYRTATYVAREQGAVVTDDNMLVERLGQTVKMVDVGPENIKITTPEDLYFAKAVLQMQRDRK